MQQHPLLDIFYEAASGRFPPPDGSVEFLPSTGGLVDAVVSFTAHSFVVADADPDEAMREMPDDGPGAPLSSRFVTWLATRLHSRAGAQDMVLTALSEGVTGAIELMARTDLADHPRVRRSALYRGNLEVFSDSDGRGLIIMSNGLAGRREVAIEVEPEHRDAGLGRALAYAARTLCAPQEPLFAQVSPGNAASVRAFLAAGFRPICAEVLFLKASAPLA